MEISLPVVAFEAPRHGSSLGGRRKRSVTSFRWRGDGRGEAPDFGKDSTPRKARDVGHPFVHELVVGTWATRPTAPCYLHRDSATANTNFPSSTLTKVSLVGGEKQATPAPNCVATLTTSFSFPVVASKILSRGSLGPVF